MSYTYNPFTDNLDLKGDSGGGTITDVQTANATPDFVEVGSTSTVDFGISNLALGSNLTNLSSGTENVAYGLAALSSVTSGLRNTAIGENSGQSLTSGSNNIAVGFDALSSVTINNNNIAIGVEALRDATSPSANVAIGLSSMRLASSVEQNVAVGNGTLSSLTTGDFNTSLGSGSLNGITTGSSNTAIGDDAGSSLTSSDSNNIMIKNGGVSGDNRTTRIGNNNSTTGQNRAFVSGITGVTVAGSEPVGVDTNAQLSGLGFGTIGQVLTSNGAATSPTWQASQQSGLLEGTTHLTLNQGFEFFTHCIETPDLTTDTNISGSSIINTDPRSGQAALHPGQWRFRLENLATSRAVMQEASAGATRPLLLGGGSWVLETLINFETLSTVSDEYVTMWGLADASDNDAITDGVYFEYDRTNSVNYIAVTESGDTRTEIDSGVAVSTTASEWVKLRFEINAAGTSVEFFVNGTSIGTSTTNIPSTDLQYFVRAMKSASTGSQNIFYMDYFYLRNELTTQV